jgi:hypothetical protein
MSKEDLRNNARKAKEVLKEYPDGIRFFHLRPTAEGVTLVTTHPDRAMRGIAGIAISRAAQMLKLAAGAISGDSVDWARIKYKKSSGDEQDMSERTEESLNSKKEREFTIQAWLINKILEGDSALCEKLRAPKLYFVGSEIIWQEGTTQGGQRLDIVAHDGDGKVLFLELKDKSNTADDGKKQLLDYLNNYGNDKDFAEFLKDYPSASPVEKITAFEGWVVIGDHTDLNIENLTAEYVKANA